MSWGQFEESAPNMALYGTKRLAGKIAFLATIKSDGSPRIHPVRPFIGAGYLFIFIDQGSPKGDDLRRDARFALHCSVRETDGLSGEFMVAGNARIVTDLQVREQAVKIVGHAVPSQYSLFDFLVERASAVEYDEDRHRSVRRWKAN